MDWLINIGGILSSSTAIFYILLFFKYKFFDKTTMLKVNIYSTLTEHYEEALAKDPEKIRNYFLEKFPIKRTEIIPNEFISEKRKDIIANISLTEPNRLAIIIGSDDSDIKILNFYDKDGNKITPIKTDDRQDMPTIKQEEINKGQLKLDKGKYVTILTQEFGPLSAQEMEIKIEGHKEKILLAPNLRHGASQYIQAKNTLYSYIKKHLTK